MEFRDAYVRDKIGCYGYSTCFQSRVKELGNFRMGEEFLREWPELKTDIERAEGARRGEVEHPKEMAEDLLGSMREGLGLGCLEELEILSAGPLGGEGGFA